MEYLSKRHPITIQLWKTSFRHLPSSWISTLAPFCIRYSTTSLRPKPNNVERKTTCDGLGGTYQTEDCSIPREYSNIYLHCQAVSAEWYHDLYVPTVQTVKVTPTSQPHNSSTAVCLYIIVIIWGKWPSMLTKQPPGRVPIYYIEAPYRLLTS